MSASRSQSLIAHSAPAGFCSGLFHAGVTLSVGRMVDPAHVDFLFALAGLRDIVRRLHPHERVHLNPEGLSTRSAMSPERSALLLRRLDSAGRET